MSSQFSGKAAPHGQLGRANSSRCFRRLHLGIGFRTLTSGRRRLEMLVVSAVLDVLLSLGQSPACWIPSVALSAAASLWSGCLYGGPGPRRRVLVWIPDE